MKLDETVERGFLVGLDEVFLGYQVYFPCKNDLLLTLNMNFIEEPDEHFIMKEIYTSLNLKISVSTNESFTRRRGRPRKSKNEDGDDQNHGGREKTDVRPL